MKDYEQKVYELRREIVNAIIDLLKEHDLKELELFECSGRSVLCSLV